MVDRLEDPGRAGPVTPVRLVGPATGERRRQLILLDESPHCFWIGDDSAKVQEATREWLRQRL